MRLHVLITGSTGMIGKGVLLECLEDERIGKVTVLNRSTLGMRHPKLNEVLLKDFTQLHTISNQLEKPDACFHCMGVSALGLSETDYTKLTFDVSKSIADVMYALNPAMVFIYVSGTGTDSSEKGSSMWARVKGRTENYILKKGFSKAVMFRPGAIIPEKGIKSRTGWYSVVYTIMTPFFPLLKKSRNITTTSKIGQAMINTLLHPVDNTHPENAAINRLAELK